MKAKAFVIQFGGHFERLMSWIIIIKSIIIIGTRDCKHTATDHFRNPLGIGKLENNTKRALEIIL